MLNIIKFIAPVAIGVVLLGNTATTPNNNVEVVKEKTTITVSGIMPGFSKEDLVQKADVIIKGVVNNVEESEWSNNNPFIKNSTRNVLQTDIKVDIKEVIKGQPYDEDNVVVRINKGENADTIYESEGYPDFEEGEEVILFLSIDDSMLKSSENYYILTGMRQGKFTLEDQDSYVFSSDDRDITKEEVYDIIEDFEKGIMPYSIEMTKEEIRENNKELFGE